MSEACFCKIFFIILLKGNNTCIVVAKRHCPALPKERLTPVDGLLEEEGCFLAGKIIFL
jgi:hypothetical protein